MRTEFRCRRGLKGLALAAAVTLALTAGGAGAQIPPGGAPPGASDSGGPPAGAPQAPTGQGAGAPNAAGRAFGPPRPPLSPVEKLVTELPPPQGGGGPPLQTLAADAPMPSADPHDLRGTWIHDQPLAFRMQRDMYGVLVPYNMDGAKVLERRVMSLKNGAPYTNASAICRPPGPQWQHDLNMPFQIFQSPDVIEFVFEEYHGRWYVIMDPAKAPPPRQKEYMGYSVGHWDGSTLVVESSNFKQALWMDVDGTPVSANGKLIQRIRKIDNGDHAPFLEIETTVVDPTYYTRPWTVVRTFAWRPVLTAFNEYNCEEQIGDPTVDADAGLVPEPKD